MRILLGLKDFGKIKSAEVDIKGFSVFVGDNNSGKTYAMQLIYGVLKNIINYMSDTDIRSRYLNCLKEQNAAGMIIMDAASIQTIERFLNEILQKYKEEIVLDTFYEEIEIGEIYLRFLLEENEQFEYLIYDPDESAEKQEAVLHYLHEIGQLEFAQIIEEQKAFQTSEAKSFILKFHVLNKKKKLMNSYANLPSGLLPTLFVRFAIDLLPDPFSEILFLPAARGGLLMLYKEFFAARAEDAVNMLKMDKNGSFYKESKKMDITQPIYDFLRFMLTFSLKRNSSENREFIQFIEGHLIEGKILFDQRNQPVYQAQGAQRELPLYLSSSMVNELMPVFYALQSAEQPRCLIWDEIETSLHPRKQMELVRLLSRMNNAGISMIVSTHSDTMAAKINNLCLLSFSQFLKGKRADILKKAGLEEKDLLEEMIHVYQFENDSHGRSFIRELEFDEMTGYQFTLFNDSVEKLFQETRLILE